MPRLVGAASASALLVLTALSYRVRVKAAPFPVPVIPVLTILFITSGSIIVSYIAARAYTRESLPSMLFVGSGALVFGSASLVAALMAGTQGSNASTTIFIVGAFASSGLHAACAASRLFTVKEHEGSRVVVSSAVALSLVLVAAVSAAAVRGVLPTFLGPGVGTTLLARVLLVASIATFGLASLLISLYSESVILYWYSWALALTSVGLIGILLSNWAFQAVVFWVGRTGLCLGGVFLVLSVLAAEGEGGGEGDGPAGSARG